MGVNYQFNSKYSLHSFCLLFVLFITACKSSTFYTPIRQNQDMVYQAKPARFDSIKTNYYVSGNMYNDAAANVKDEINMVELQLSRAHLLGKRFNLAYGVFSFWGSYDNNSLTSDDDYYFTKKKFHGYGFRSSVNYILYPDGEDNSDLRFPCFEFSYSKESGAFAAYRKMMLNQPYYFTNDNTDLYTAGLSFEYIWHNWRKKHIRYSIRCFKGWTLENNDFYTQQQHIKNDVLNRQFDISFLFQYRQFLFLMDINKQAPKIGLTFSLR